MAEEIIVIRNDAPTDTRSGALYETLRERLLANATLTRRARDAIANANVIRN